jgi:hypothetical protein
MRNAPADRSAFAARPAGGARARVAFVFWYFYGRSAGGA